MNLSLCMIVRNEAEMLPRCLASVQGVVDEIVVVDTGSTDQTPELARQYGARVDHHPWNHDFSEARNRSLELAQGRWILVLDADEELPEEMKSVILQLIADEQVEGYLTEIINIVGNESNPDIESSVNLRLFRNRPDYRFSGRLHEQIGENMLRANPAARLMDGGLQIRHRGYLDQVVSARGKENRNLVLARELVSAAPGDPFARFNLGIELERKGDHAGAVAEFAASYALHTPGSYWSSKLVKSYAIALTKHSNTAGALALLEREIPRYPRFTDLYFLKGLVLDTEGKHEEAAACFEQCLELGPAPVPPYTGVETAMGTTKAWFALGQQYEALGRIDEALAAYHHAFSGKLTWLDPVHRLGALLLRHRGVPATGAYLEKMFGPGTATRILLTDILMRERRYDLALETLDGVDPEEAAAREAAAYLRSRCLLKLGRHEEAVALAQTIPSSSPHFHPALVNQVYCLWVEGQEREARRIMRKHRLGDQFRSQISDLFLEEAEEVLQEGLRRFPGATLLEESLTEVQRARRS